MDDTLRTRHGPLVINYGAATSTDVVNQTMLWIAQQENLLRYRGSTSSGYYLIVINGRRRLLTATEVEPYVLALFDATGKDITPVAYRTGLIPASGEGDHGQ